MGFALDTVDDAFILHLLIGALLGPTFLGIYLYYKYNIIDKLSNSQVGIDIFSDHIILHGDHHTFHLPIKNLIVKVEPILHLKIKNSGIIIISSDDKHYYLHMNKDVDKFLIVLDKLKIKNSTYLIPSVGVIVVAYSLLIFPELNVKISYDWIIFSLAFLFLLCRHITWIYK